MPMTDPLIKSLKYLIEEFLSVGEPIDDSSPYLAPFCQTVEHALTKGIKLGGWDFLKQDGQSMKRKQFWTVIEHFQTSGPIPLSLSNAIMAAQQNTRLKYGDGKVRYIIRHCLVRKTLHVLVEFFITRKADLQGYWFHKSDELDPASSKTDDIAIMTSEHLAEQLRSLLMTISSSLTFKLNQDNSYFLDQTWNIPDMRTVEFVPTQELGLGILFIHGHIIITKTKKGSVAADNSDIGVGDLLVSLNDRILFQANTNGENDAVSAWKKCKRKGEPCQMTVIKPRCPATGGIFNPLRGIISQYQDIMEAYYEKKQRKFDKKQRATEDIEAMHLSPIAAEKGRAPVADGKTSVGIYPICYIGEAFVGSSGGMSQIEGVIKSAVRRKSPLTAINVLLEITEISVITRSTCTDDLKKIPESKTSEEPSEGEEVKQDILTEICEKINHEEESSVFGATNDNSFEPCGNSTQIHDGNETIFSHKFADISSCGKIITDEKHFCYIAGDTFCTISKQFKGYVYQAQSVGQARLILNSIYQGFKRTTFFM